jgi:hypothetical protein
MRLPKASTDTAKACKKPAFRPTKFHIAGKALARSWPLTGVNGARKPRAPISHTPYKEK